MSNHTATTRVTLGTIDYPAVVADNRWNGFAMPSFTRETVEQIAIDLRQSAAAYGLEEETLIPIWSDARGGFVLLSGGTLESERAYQDRPEMTMEDAEFVAADANGLYPVGAGSWAWEVVEDDE